MDGLCRLLHSSLCRLTCLSETQTPFRPGFHDFCLVVQSGCCCSHHHTHNSRQWERRRAALKIGTPCCSQPAGRNSVTQPQPARRGAGTVALLLGSLVPARTHGCAAKQRGPWAPRHSVLRFPGVLVCSPPASQHVPLEVWFVSTSALAPLIPFNTSWPPHQAAKGD